MRAIKMLGACMLAVGVVGAAATSASAETVYEPTGLPEIGRCVKEAGGNYLGKSCVKKTAEGKGTYEWKPGPGEKGTFVLEIGEVILKTVKPPGGESIKVSCGFSEVIGQWTGSKTASINLVFQGCLNDTTVKPCQTNPTAKAEISTISIVEGNEIQKPIEGELGFIKNAATKTGQRIGLDLKPKGSEKELLSFTCGEPLKGEIPGEQWKLEGSAIGRVKPLDLMKTNLSAYYKAVNGVQVPEMFEGGVKDVLIAKRIPNASIETKTEQAGLQFQEEEKHIWVNGEQAEPLEIKTL
jgi:hypothetical protein